jgi:hypothetical protein
MPLTEILAADLALGILDQLVAAAEGKGAKASKISE